MSRYYHFWKLTLLILCSGGLVYNSSEGRTAGAEQGDALEIGWSNRYTNPRDEIEFLGFSSADKDELWVVVKTFREPRSTAETRFQLWHFEAGDRRGVYEIPITADRTHPVDFKTMRSSDSDAVVLGFVENLSTPLVILFDQSSRKFQETWKVPLGEGISAARQIALHRDQRVTVSAVSNGLPVLFHFDPNREERWRYRSQGMPGQFTSVHGLRALGPGLAAVGLLVPEPESPQVDNEETSLLVFDMQGRLVSKVSFDEREVHFISSGSQGVAVSLGRIAPGVPIPLRTYDLDTGDENAPKVVSSAVLPAEKGRHKRIGITQTCNGMYAYATKATVPDVGDVIRLSVLDDSKLAFSKNLRGNETGDLMALRSISLLSQGSTIYVAATLIRIDETRVLRAGVDLYRVDASALCAANEQ